METSPSLACLLACACLPSVFCHHHCLWKRFLWAWKQNGCSEGKFHVESSWKKAPNGQPCVGRKGNLANLIKSARKDFSWQEVNWLTFICSQIKFCVHSPLVGFSEAELMVLVMPVSQRQQKRELSQAILNQMDQKWIRNIDTFNGERKENPSW